MIIVTTPAATTDLTTLAAVKSELGLSTNEHDAQIASYISQASDSVKAYCNRTFARESVIEAFRVDLPSEPLVLTLFPVSAIDSIIENGVALTTDDFFVDDRDGTLWRLSNDRMTHWPCGKISVAYTAGYLLPGDDGRDLPHDIERAVIMLAAQSFLGAGTDARVKRESVDGIGSTERFLLSASGMTPDAEALLARYRQVAV
jgi:uncharacterized phiE125 gp8 family phage protein